MNRRVRVSVGTAALATMLLVVIASPSLAATVSFATSYAAEIDPYGGGSVTYKYGSGIPNYLRATAAGEALGTPPVLLSVRQGRLSSTSVRYTGATGGSITVRVSGNFSRDLSGGISLINGAGFTHEIRVALRDVTNGADTRNWLFVHEEILCGGLIYPIGLGGCNGSTSDTFPTSITRTASGSGLINGHYYLIRVYVGSIINAAGLAFGLQARTTARDVSGSISW